MIRRDSAISLLLLLEGLGATLVLVCCWINPGCLLLFNFRASLIHSFEGLRLLRHHHDTVERVLQLYSVSVLHALFVAFPPIYAAQIINRRANTLWSGGTCKKGQAIALRLLSFAWFCGWVFGSLVLLVHIGLKRNQGYFCEGGNAAAGAYNISGATNSDYNGLYVQTTHICNTRPVFQKGGLDGFVLFQPSGKSYWVVDINNTSCDDIAYLSSINGQCGERPDGADCAGIWIEWEAVRQTGQVENWRKNSNIVAAAAPAHGTTASSSSSINGLSCTAILVLVTPHLVAIFVMFQHGIICLIVDCCTKLNAFCSKSGAKKVVASLVAWSLCAFWLGGVVGSEFT